MRTRLGSARSAAIRSGITLKIGSSVENKLGLAIAFDMRATLNQKPDKSSNHHQDANHGEYQGQTIHNPASLSHFWEISNFLLLYACFSDSMSDRLNVSSLIASSARAQAAMYFEVSALC